MPTFRFKHGGLSIVGVIRMSFTMKHFKKNLKSIHQVIKV